MYTVRVHRSYARRWKRKFDLLERYIQVLMLLSESPDISIREIARRIHASPYAVSKWVRELELMGLVERRAVGRSHLVRLTKKGIEACLVASRLLQYIKVSIPYEAKPSK